MPMLKASAINSWRSALPKSNRESVSSDGRAEADSTKESPQNSQPDSRNESSPTTARWRNRIAVIEAAFLLILAKFLVRFVRLGAWRMTLGGLINQKTSADEAIEAQPSADPIIHAESTRIARCVYRAVGRLPGRTKCLPQAVALQWMLKRRSISSRLVIAALKTPETPDADPFHAWVERGEIMLIGICDKQMYEAIMTFSSAKTVLSNNQEDVV